MHYRVSKKFGVPIIWLPEIERANGVDLWGGSGHPHCEQQTIHVKLIHNMFQETMKRVCMDGVQGADGILPVTMDESMQKCITDPKVSAFAAMGKNAFPVKSVGNWEFKEDVPGKPGWIAPSGES